MCVHTTTKSPTKVGEKNDHEKDFVTLTDYKSTVGQLYKWSISVDWFEVYTLGFLFASGTDAPPKRAAMTTRSGKQIELIQIQKGAGHWQYLYHLQFKGEPEPFAQIVTLPRKGNVLDPAASQIKVMNHYLYRDGWEKLFNEVVVALSVRVKSITRLDIAVDSTNDLLEIYSRFLTGEIEAKGRDVANDSRNIGRKLDLYHWGSSKSNKHAKGYRKGEIVEGESKNYIIESWVDRGVIEPDDPQAKERNYRKVTRFELTLKSEACKLMLDEETGELGLDISRLGDPSYLAGLLRAGLDGWFTFLIPSETDKNRSRWAEVPFIDFEALEACPIVRLTKTRSSSQIWRAKQATKKLLIDANDGGYLKDACREFLQERGTVEIDGERLELITKAAIAHLENNWHYKVPDELVRGMLHSVFNDGLLNGVLKGVATEFGEDIPLFIAGQMAREHHILPWFHRQAYGESVALGNKLVRETGKRITRESPTPKAVAV
ncbi:MAG: hypothetical protein DA408_14470 [Bacteroidetes bacterium]|nr:MAG: hypothetical protein DA408_14470 [Bacteroidota bacterium]